jgi:hypothetical protein
MAVFSKVHKNSTILNLRNCLPSALCLLPSCKLFFVCAYLDKKKPLFNVPSSKVVPFVLLMWRKCKFYSTFLVLRGKMGVWFEQRRTLHSKFSTTTVLRTFMVWICLPARHNVGFWRLLCANNILKNMLLFQYRKRNCLTLEICILLSVVRR